MQSNDFDEVLGLEEEFYNDGYQQGLADGTRAGRIEGRTFGLEKGFEKYVESGRLNGKGIIWANRICQQRKEILPSESQSTPKDLSDGTSVGGKLTLPLLPTNLRLTKHIKILYALAESESLSTENTEDAVSDFDDRLKRAQAKAKIVEKMAGETKGDVGDSKKSLFLGGGSIEDALNSRH
jgi:hypothetical protein